MATRSEVLTGRLAVDTSAWSTGLMQASSMFKGFAGGIGRGLTQAFANSYQAIKGVVGKIGGAIRSTIGTALQALGIGGLLSGGGILAGLNNIAQLGGTISDLSERTGIAASAITILREQFRQGGIEADSVTQYIRRMFAALDDPKKADVFKRLGLDQGSLARMNPDMAFNRILDGVRKLRSKMQQANILSELFGGRQGINLMTLVADRNSFNSAKEMVGSMARDMDKFAPIFDRISDILGPGGIGVKMQQIFFGILKGFSTDLLKLADKFSKLDFQRVGENITEWLKWGWSTFQALVANPSGVWAAMSDGFQGVAQLAASYFIGAMKVLPTALVSFTTQVLPPLALTIFSALKAAGGALAIGILEGMETIKEILPKSVRNGLDKVMSASAMINDFMPTRWMTPLITGKTNKDLYEHMRDNPKAIRTVFEQGVQEDLQTAMQEMANTMQGGQQTLDDVFNAFEPNAALLEQGSKQLADALKIFDQVQKPAMNPVQALFAPGATQPQSIFRQSGGDSRGLQVSLANNKIEMSGPVAERMVHHLARIEDNLAIE